MAALTVVRGARKSLFEKSICKREKKKKKNLIEKERLKKIDINDKTKPTLDAKGEIVLL